MVIFPVKVVIFLGKFTSGGSEVAGPVAVRTVQVRALNNFRAFERNAGAGGGVRRRETPARRLKCAFGG